MSKKKKASTSMSVKAKTNQVPMPEPINESDLKWDLLRDESALLQRVTHIPTGITAECSEEKTPVRNRQVALDRLAQKLKSHNLEIPVVRTRTNWSFIICDYDNVAELASIQSASVEATENFNDIIRGCANPSEFNLKELEERLLDLYILFDSSSTTDEQRAIIFQFLLEAGGLKMFEEFFGMLPPKYLSLLLNPMIESIMRRVCEQHDERQKVRS